MPSVSVSPTAVSGQLPAGRPTVRNAAERREILLRVTRPSERRTIAPLGRCQELVPGISVLFNRQPPCAQTPRTQPEHKRWVPWYYKSDRLVPKGGLCHVG